eukprot:1806716-Pyramimonas_sp.AAC.1
MGVVVGRCFWSAFGLRCCRRGAWRCRWSYWCQLATCCPQLKAIPQLVQSLLQVLSRYPLVWWRSKGCAKDVLTCRRAQ